MIVRTSSPGISGRIGVQPHANTSVVSSPVASEHVARLRRDISSSEKPSRAIACAGHCDAHAPHAWHASGVEVDDAAHLDARSAVRADAHARQARGALLRCQARAGRAPRAALCLAGRLVLRVAELDLVEGLHRLVVLETLHLDAASRLDVVAHRLRYLPEDGVLLIEVGERSAVCR